MSVAKRSKSKRTSSNGAKRSKAKQSEGAFLRSCRRSPRPPGDTFFHPSIHPSADTHACPGQAPTTLSISLCFALLHAKLCYAMLFYAGERKRDRPNALLRRPPARVRVAWPSVAKLSKVRCCEATIPSRGKQSKAKQSKAKLPRISRRAHTFTRSLTHSLASIHRSPVLPLACCMCLFLCFFRPRIEVGAPKLAFFSLAVRFITPRVSRV